MNIHIIFFFNDTATTEIYTLSLHDALPIWPSCASAVTASTAPPTPMCPARTPSTWSRSEEHTSELQSHSDLVCRLLLEKKKQPLTTIITSNINEAIQISLFEINTIYVFFNDTATTEIYTLSLHDALPIRQDALDME